MSKTLHWLSAIVIVALFVLGFWMVDLDYYSEWYQTAPHWHESIGVLLCLLTLGRVLNRCLQTSPEKLASISEFQQKAAHFAHIFLYVLLFFIFMSGYLIPTANGSAIKVFTWFSVPALGALFTEQADISGSIHKYSAYVLIGLSLLHTIAALKHHFIDKDNSLIRMIK